MSEPTVLFVSTDSSVIATMRRVLGGMRYRLNVASSLEEAGAWRDTKSFDAILVQTDDPQSNIRRRINDGLRLRRTPPVVAIAKSGSIPDAVQAIRAGACEYLAGEAINHGALRDALRRAMDDQDRPLRLGSSCEPFPELITSDYRMLQVCETLTAAADSKATILMEGESGTGKNLLARGVHGRSARREGPFLEVNCGVLSDALLESELFGHARGAFTSAYRERRGKFEIADGGTLMLDEIANASLAFQTRLLHAVETGRFERIGETETIESDVRMIVATNVSLEERVASGLFREDLYHRLSTLKVRLPPLRERVGDIPLLARRFLTALARRNRRTVSDFSTEALERMVHYAWPGNVRELKNIVERAVVLTQGELVLPEALPPHVAASRDAAGESPRRAEGHSLRDALRAPERRYLLEALQRTQWNKQTVARELGISRSTLYKKMKEHGLDRLQPAETCPA